MRDTVFRPTVEEIQDEIDYLRGRSRSRRKFWIILFVLLVIIAGTAAGLLYYFPVLKVKDSGMEPTLAQGEVVVVSRGDQAKREKMIAFRSNGEVMMKRVIGLPGDKIFIRRNGTVLVNDKELDESYIKEKKYGECDLKFPYTVPEGQVFVLGDNREISIDSRSESIGCIPKKDIIGEIQFRVWPLGGSD